jgi:hypothetical protein
MDVEFANTSSMKVNPSHHLPAAAQATRTTTKPAAVPEASAAQPEFAASVGLAKNLAATPEVRADQVARAKALIADPNYPNAKTVQAVARRLANKIQGPSANE